MISDIYSDQSPYATYPADTGQNLRRKIFLCFSKVYLNIYLVNIVRTISHLITLMFTSHWVHYRAYDIGLVSTCHVRVSREEVNMHTRYSYPYS